MIVQSFPCKNKVVPFESTSSVVQKEAAKHSLTVEEFERRSKIVREAYTKTKLKVKGMYLPEDEKYVKEFGVCTITEIIRSMWEWPVGKKWPKDDDPTIVSFTALGFPGKTYFASVDWFNPKLETNNVCS